METVDEEKLKKALEQLRRLSEKSLQEMAQNGVLLSDDPDVLDKLTDEIKEK